MPMTSTSLPDAASIAIRALFDHTYLDQSSKLFYKDLGFVEGNAEASDEQFNSWSGPGAAPLVVENEQYGAVERFRGYPVTVSLRKYASELNVTEEQIHWLQTASRTRTMWEINNAVEGAIHALNYRVDDDHAKVHYLGFGTTFLASVGNSEALVV